VKFHLFLRTIEASLGVSRNVIQMWLKQVILSLSLSPTLSLRVISLRITLGSHNALQRADDAGRARIQVKIQICAKDSFLDQDSSPRRISDVALDSSLYH